MITNSVKEQDVKNSSGGEGWRQRERGIGQNFKKMLGRVLGTLCQL